MTKRVMVVFHESDQIRAIEQAIVDRADAGPATFHIVSTDDGNAIEDRAMVPRRMRLMLLLAKLVDRSITAGGEDAALTDVVGIGQAVRVHRPDEVVISTAVAVGAPGIDRVLGAEVELLAHTAAV